MGVISLRSKFQPYSSSNGRDMNIYKSKMAVIGTSAKPNLLRLLSNQVLVICLEVISFDSKFEPVALETDKKTF